LRSRGASKRLSSQKILAFLDRGVSSALSDLRDGQRADKFPYVLPA
jgi:nitroimidazol reductase NimA-like FMN-containing flavoprotein (pyridoxamine 5'-phosphate oxidase superfamily)